MSKPITTLAFKLVKELEAKKFSLLVMTTRGRSKTADPGDLRKVARAHHAPRKFTEKIAMMKQREAQHAAAFAEVMAQVRTVIATIGAIIIWHRCNRKQWVMAKIWEAQCPH